MGIGLSLKFDLSQLATSDKTVTWPNQTGNVLIGTTAGLNIDYTNSRLGIGTSTPAFLLDIYSSATSTTRFDTDSTSKGACLVLKDRDGVGYTYVTANNGTLTASATACN